MTARIPTVTFNNGIHYPILGLGTSRCEKRQLIEAVKIAIDAGYRHFDCSPCYLNEKEVGEGIKQKIDEGVVKREELFITSKLPPNSHKPKHVLPALEKTLSDLELSYVDLYLIHSPIAYEYKGDDFWPKDENGKLIYSDAHYVDTWKAMEALVEKGLVKSIGISNFNSKQVDEVLAVAKIVPVTNQVECHPYFNQNKLKQFCESKGILITAYGPLGTPGNSRVPKDDPILLKEPTVLKLADKYAKSPAQILIRYQVQKGNMVIPKSVTKARIIENANVFDFALENSDLNALDSLNTKVRYFPFKMCKDSKFYPFDIEF